MKKYTRFTIVNKEKNSFKLESVKHEFTLHFIAKHITDYICSPLFNPFSLQM